MEQTPSSLPWPSPWSEPPALWPEGLQRQPGYFPASTLPLLFILQPTVRVNLLQPKSDQMASALNSPGSPISCQANGKALQCSARQTQSAPISSETSSLPVPSLPPQPQGLPCSTCVVMLHLKHLHWLFPLATVFFLQIPA